MVFNKLRPVALSVVTSTALLFGGVGVQAAPAVDIDGALYLQNKIKEQLDAVGQGLVQEGDVVVEPAGTYYAVTLPHLKYDIGMAMGLPSDAQSAQQPAGAVFDFGISAMNMVPTDTKGQYVFAQSLPTPWRFVEGDKEQFRIEIGQQKTNGIFDLEMQMPIRLDAEYKDLRFVMGDNAEINVVVDSVTSKGGYKEEPQGFYSGQMPVEINGLKVMGPQNMLFFSVDKIRGYSGYTALSRENTIKCAADMTRVNKQLTSFATSGQMINPSIISGYVDGVLSCMGMMADGIEGGLVIEGVKAGPALMVALGHNQMDMKSVYIQQQYNDISKDKMTATVRLGMQDLKLDPWPAQFSRFAPRSFHFDVGLDNIPHGKLYEVIQGIMGYYAQNPQEVAASPAVVFMPVLARLPQLLNEAQSGIVANDVRIGGADYQLMLKGRMQADISALLGVSGKMDLIFYGMDKFMEGVMAEAQDPNNPNAMGMMPILMPVQMLHQLGQDDGKGNRTFVFEVTQQGKMLLNGQDMSALMGGAIPNQQ